MVREVVERIVAEKIIEKFMEIANGEVPASPSWGE